jgi:Bacterial TSP3 repeat
MKRPSTSALFTSVALLAAPFALAGWLSPDPSFPDHVIWSDGNTETIIEGAADSDSDGLTNAEEYNVGSDPYAIDTDGDGATDGDEVNLTLTNPTDSISAPTYSYNTGNTSDSGTGDTSGSSGTDTTGSADTTGSTGTDTSGSNSGDGGSTGSSDDGGTIAPTDEQIWAALATDDPSGDVDSDSLTNAYEVGHGYNPTQWDSNGNGYSDYDESIGCSAVHYGSGLPDHANASFKDYDGDGATNAEDPAPADPNNQSTANGQNWYSEWSADSDNDGFSNFYDPAPNDWSNYSWSNSTTWGSDLFGDADNDWIFNYYDSSPNPWVDTASYYYYDYSYYYNYTDPSFYYCCYSDSDSDGLNSDEENSIGTSDYDQDSDDDGLTDYEEARTYYTSPTNPFSYVQTHGGAHYMDYYRVDSADTDAGTGDGIPDRIEQFYGLNPTDPNDAEGDMDGDGVSNLDQYNMGLSLNAGRSLYDTDLDGMTDVFELHYNLEVNNFADAVADLDGDGVFNFEESRIVANPRNAHSRPNGASDWERLISCHAVFDSMSDVTARLADHDFDGDGLPDAWEHRYGRLFNPTDGMRLRYNDAAADNDSDTLSNAEEFTLGFSPLLQQSQSGIADAQADRDGDGITDLEELRRGFDYNNAKGDFDQDGITDAQEIAEGTDPADALSNSTLLLGLRVISPLESI